VASSSGFWQTVFSTQVFAIDESMPDMSLFGVALGRWELVSAASYQPSCHLEALLIAAAKRRVTGPGGVANILLYKAIDFLECGLSVFHECVGRSASTILNELLGVLFCRADVHGIYNDHNPLNSFLQDWKRQYNIAHTFVCPLGDSTCLAVVDGLRLFHAVAFGDKSPPRRLFIGGYPSPAVIKDWIKNHPAPSAGHAAAPEAVPVRAQDHPAGLILDWLRATRHLKMVRSAKLASCDWARLFSRAGPESLADMNARVKGMTVNYDSLRKARVRLDAIACMLFRRYFALMKPLCLNIFVYTDASPQWRGLELVVSPDPHGYLWFPNHALNTHTSPDPYNCKTPKVRDPLRTNGVLIMI
jgi:hypothetical protein